MNNINLLIVGVGGQGVILASDAVAEIGMNNGYDVKKSDSIGMAQRGGSVVSHVRWGEHVFSPMNAKGEVDYLVGFEKLEAARSAHYLKPGGIAIVADVSIPPVSLVSNNLTYPEDAEIMDILKGSDNDVHMLPANDMCAQAGNARALNMVMLGALSVFMGLDGSVWEKDITARLRPEFVESSMMAFTLGAQEINR